MSCCTTASNSLIHLSMVQTDLKAGPSHTTQMKKKSTRTGLDIVCFLSPKEK